MEFQVELTAEALANIREIHSYIGAATSQPANLWYLGLRDLIYSLDRLPHRGRRTHEDPSLLQLLYGNKPHIYRVIYSIEDASKRVVVVHVRHGARRAFDPADLPR